MLTNFKNISLQVQPKYETRIEMLARKEQSNSGLVDQFFGCTCYHMICGHDFREGVNKAGDCGNLNCDCKVYTPRGYFINIEITKLDIFEFEYPNHSLPDSPQYWLEFGQYIEGQKSAKTKSLSSEINA